MAQSRRERFRETMEHRAPEKLVLDLGGCPLSGMAAKPKEALMDLLGLDPDPACASDTNSTRLDERLLRALEIDTRGVSGVGSRGGTGTSSTPRSPTPPQRTSRPTRGQIPRA